MKKLELPEDFELYLERLKSGEEYEDFYQSKKNINKKNKLLEGSNCVPSIVAWNFDKHPSIEKFRKDNPSVLNLDAKITNTAALKYYIDNSPHWQNLGVLEVEKYCFSPSEKKEYRERRESLSRSSDSKKEEFVDRCKSLSPISMLSRCSSPINFYQDLEHARKEIAEEGISKLKISKVSPIKYKSSPILKELTKDRAARVIQKHYRARKKLIKS